MSPPLVSVIVGVYNKDRFVGDCLKSVLAQTYPRWELIVVDDASTDASLPEIERTLAGETRARVVRMERNSGRPAVARNRACQVAKGTYVAFLDADDLWKPGKLEAQVAFMEAHPEVALSHTRCEVVDGEGRVLGVRHGTSLPSGSDVLPVLLRHCFVCTSTVMVRKHAGDVLGWFCEDPVFRCGEDFEFFLRCLRVGKLGLVDLVLGQYREVGSSVSHEDENWRCQPSDYVHKKLFLERPSLWKGAVSEKEMRRIVWAAAEENAYHWRGRGEWGKALWFAWEMAKLRPYAPGTWRQIGGILLRRR